MANKIQEDIAVIDKISLKEPSKYNVIIHDNPITSFEEVIFIVSRCFEKTEQEAEQIAQKVHLEHRGVCGTYTKEIAETKLAIVAMAKEFLIKNFPSRATSITALKFTIEEA